MLKHNLVKIAISKFCRSRDQQFCKVPLDSLIPELLHNFSSAKPGYREGVTLIPLDPKNFLGTIKTLQTGDPLYGMFLPRVAGELPRKQVKVHGIPDPVVAVDAVLYANHVLAETNEVSSPDADYEVVAVLPKVYEEEQPMHPDTLMANHFHFEGNGGTATKMTPQEFESAMRTSYHFWRNRASTV